MVRLFLLGPSGIFGQLSVKLGEMCRPTARDSKCTSCICGVVFGS